MNRTLFALLFISSTIFSQTPRYFHSAAIDANNIFMKLSNWGDISDYPPSVWNVSNVYNREIVYDLGIGFIGRVNGSVRWAWSQWNSMYSPGPIINRQSAMVINPEDSLKYRVYKINTGDDNSNPDYAQWPIHWGAPKTLSGLPQVKGNQTLWCVYNSFDTTMFRNHSWYYRTFIEEGLTPVKLEIQQTAFARNGSFADSIDIFDNTIFFEWTIINKGNENIDSAYISFWVDNDFSDLQYNAPAFSREEFLGYNWMNKEVATSLNPPMAVGFTALYTPIMPSPNDTAIFMGKKRPHYKNMPINYFWPVADKTLDGYHFDTAFEDSTFWNLARGFDLNGNIVINPSTNQRTFSPLDGDPVNQTGWYWDEGWTNGEAGFYFFFGPMNFAAQDTQWLMTALVPALGANRFESIKLMRQKAGYLRSLPYDSIAFGNISFGITDLIGDKITLPERFQLLQNFPNPFNPSTVISYQLSAFSNVVLKIFDVLGNEVATLVKEEKPAGVYEVEFSGSNLPSGIYFYQLRVGQFVETRKMIYLK